MDRSDSRPPIRTRRWVRIALSAAIAGNLIGAGGAIYLLGGPDELTVEEAVRQFRDQATNAAPGAAAPAKSASPRPKASPTGSNAPASKKATSKSKTSTSLAYTEPALGVYVYDTDGYEETDALSGQRHDYPAQTALTISRQGCGLRYRWQPLKERWEESDGCQTTAGIELSRFAIHHEFFKKAATEEFILEAESVVMPANPVVGATWHWKGASDDSAIDNLTKVMGFETIAVGAEQVKTVHIRYETAMSGDNEGTQIQDRWMSMKTGLLIRMVTAVDAKVEIPFGGTANYRERARIDLTSLEPSS